ncbi:MAG: MFS transporter [Bacteroidota bacterium]|jgi:GPH family glycoside/pentoside/hexuronide:cation symporter
MSEAIQKLPLREKIGYGFGDFASVLFWQSITMNMMFFYTDVFKIAETTKAAVVAGTMIMTSRLFDAVIDPIIGMTADRTETRWGKFRPYLLWMSLPLAISAVLTFSTPDLGPSGKIVYAYLTLFLFMACYAGINIPYSSLLGVLTPDPTQRTSASSFKFTFAYISGMTVSATSLLLAKHFGNGVDTKDPGGWTKTIMLYGIVAIVFFALTFLLTKERVRPPKSQKTSVKRDLTDLVTNVPWIVLLFATISMIMFVASRIGVTNYYFKYYITNYSEVTHNTINYSFLSWNFTWGFEEVATVFNTLGQGCAILGALLVPLLTARIGKKNSFLLLFAIAIVSTAVFYFLTPQDLTLIFLFQITGSLSGGPLSPVIWAMYADTADFSEWKRGRRATGLVFSASATCQKVGWAIGALFTGALLSSYGFIADKAQSLEVSHLLTMLMSIIPSAFGLISVILILFYKLDEKTMKQIQTDLEERRKAGGNEPLAV